MTITIKSDWYQNNTRVFLDIFAKNLSTNQVTVHFFPQAVHVKINAEDIEYDRIYNLFQAIDPSQCKVSIGKVKVEIEMVKKDINHIWKSLEEVSEEVEQQQSFSASKYPSSAKNPVDLNFKDLEADPEPTGEAAINALFQNIYSDASDDTRRAMMKSFIESKGTVLSTNWNEVGSKTVDPVPPKSQ